MKKIYPPSIPHDQSMAELFARKPKFAAECLKSAMEEATDEEGQQVLLAIMKQIALSKGLNKVAKRAKIPPESLSRALSPRGNPRLSTLLPVIRAMGLHLTVRT